MKISLKHQVKRIKQTAYIKLRSMIDPTYKGEIVSHQQTSAYLICKKLVEKPDVVLLMSPISGKRYIKLDNEQIFVIISTNHVQIINHVYSYTIPMEGRMLNKILDVFDHKMEEMRNKMEDEITCNIQRSLNQISKDLDNNVNNFQKITA